MLLSRSSNDSRCSFTPLSSALFGYSGTKMSNSPLYPENHYPRFFSVGFINLLNFRSSMPFLWLQYESVFLKANFCFFFNSDSIGSKIFIPCYLLLALISIMWFYSSCSCSPGYYSFPKLFQFTRTLSAVKSTVIAASSLFLCHLKF